MSAVSASTVSDVDLRASLTLDAHSRCRRCDLPIVREWTCLFSTEGVEHASCELFLRIYVAHRDWFAWSLCGCDECSEGE